jgi:ubiquinone/menaquinone biosynthesis C-methylase UbiE
VTTEPDVSVARSAGLQTADAILPPPGMTAVPPYEMGWRLHEGPPEAFLSYVDSDPSVNWSDGLEALHEEASRTHFLDRWTRSSITEGIGAQRPDATFADIGCSTGYLLEDLHAAYPQASLIGVDLIAAGLRKAHRTLPSAWLLRADACRLPLADQSVDAVVSANLLEHIPDDRLVLREIARVLRPGGRAAVVVPAGRHSFDYYDRFLGHVRRYGHGELASKCETAGLEPLEQEYIASLLYPVFWLVKQHNRVRHGGLQGDRLEAKVAADINRTRDSRYGEIGWRLELRLRKAGIHFPFGIRCLVVAQRCVA